MKTGWIPSPITEKDLKHPLSSIGLALSTVPKKASLGEYVTRIDDQKTKPWCVAFGVCNAIEFQMRKEGLPVPTGGFSKAWLYARCKQLDGMPDEDGTQIKVALWIALNEGLCPEYLLPTPTWLGRENLPQLTSQMAREASRYKIAGFSRLMDSNHKASLHQVKQALAKGGFAIIASLVEQDNWMDNDDLIVIPKGETLGGHCTYLFGYDEDECHGQWIDFVDGANSWGVYWGNDGKYNMAKAYWDYKDKQGYDAVLEAWAFTVTKPKSKGIWKWFEKIRRFL